VFIRKEIISGIFGMTVSAATVGISLTVIMDCVMTFFGSTANDAAFNAWLTDSTDSTNRGAAEGINAMMPLVSILVVFGGFMFLNLDMPSSWITVFTVIGIVVLIVGILGFFIIKEPNVKPSEENYLKGICYGFMPQTVKENKSLYMYLAAFVIFNISIQIFMPYLIIYYEVSLKMSNYVLIMAPAIVLASIVTALWGRVYDKKGFRFSFAIAMLSLIAGYVVLYFTRTTVPVFVGSLLMMCGYLAGMAVFGAVIRDYTPQGKAGRLQGIRIFSQVLLPGIIGPFIGKKVLENAEIITNNDGTTSFVPNADIFLAALVAAVIILPFAIIKNKKEK
jgi:MFS family permease